MKAVGYKTALPIIESQSLPDVTRPTLKRRNGTRGIAIYKKNWQPSPYQKVNDYRLAQPAKLLYKNTCLPPS